MSSKNGTDTSLSGKIAIVTGGTRGIGRAIAERLLQEGARVALCGTTQQTVDKAMASLTSVGEVFGAVADVSIPEQVEAFVTSVESKFGGVDILINNAGVGTFRPVAELTHAEWERMIGLNLTGVYYCCHAVLPIFKKRGAGYVINISSLAGKNPFAGGAGYNASKFGLNGFSEAMMLDHRYDGRTGVLRSCPEVWPLTLAAQSAAAADWKIAPEDIADIGGYSCSACLPGLPSARVEVRPSRPPRKA